MAKKSEPSRKNFWPNNKSNSEESNADDESNASSWDSIDVSILDNMVVDVLPANVESADKIDINEDI